MSTFFRAWQWQLGLGSLLSFSGTILQKIYSNKAGYLRPLMAKWTSVRSLCSLGLMPLSVKPSTSLYPFTEASLHWWQKVHCSPAPCHRLLKPKVPFSLRIATLECELLPWWAHGVMCLNCRHRLYRIPWMALYWSCPVENWLLAEKHLFFKLVALKWCVLWA